MTVLVSKVEIEDKYYIATTFAPPDPLKLILKSGDTYGVFDRFGDIIRTDGNEHGLYHAGTRFLSVCRLNINNARPLFLSSTVDEDNLLMTVDMSNPDFYQKDTCVFRRDSVHILRSRFLCDDRWHEFIRIRNFGNIRIEFSLSLSFDADFSDVFEIRGMKRERRGSLFPVNYAEDSMIFSYTGLDQSRRTTILLFSDPPDAIIEKKALFKCNLEPAAERRISFSVHCLVDGEAGPSPAFDEEVSKMQKRKEEASQGQTGICTSNDQFNESLRRARADIAMMTTETEYGHYPYGGIPWFCTPFGRDGIITAMQCLWYNPELARGVLKYLASRQSTEFDQRRAAQPGKILHEVRAGEMAAMNEIPFGLYYGSVDSTPLFIILAGMYWRRTGDSELIRFLWKNIHDALIWMDKYGDVDGDGFIEYIPDENGLRNQGWKDSQDSVFYEDGSLVSGPIALCEVQAYVYAAKIEAAALAEYMGDSQLSQRLLEEAATLRDKFNKLFWDEDLGCYVLALDEKKRPCRIVSSNAGHAVFAGITDYERAEKIAETLVSNSSFSGWGIRTVASGAPLYNPMSYHNGSIWPHDNSIIAAGFAFYGLKEAFSKIFTAIFEASLYMELHRLPELFCGFHRRKGVAPTLYPVACSPQTWASGSLPFMLQASLGLRFEASKNRVIFHKPHLPEFLEYVQLQNLKVAGEKTADILIRRYGVDVAVEVTNKHKDINVIIMK